MKSDKVLLNSFDTHPEAALLQSFLDHQGIPSEIVNAHISSVNHLYSNLVGGIKLYVNESDAEKAKELMNSGVHSSSVEANTDDLPDELKEHDEPEQKSTLSLKKKVFLLYYIGVPFIIYYILKEVGVF
jgi:hypothetical protein